MPSSFANIRSSFSLEIPILAAICGVPMGLAMFSDMNVIAERRTGLPTATVSDDLLTVMPRGLTSNGVAGSRSPPISRSRRLAVPAVLLGAWFLAVRWRRAAQKSPIDFIATRYTPSMCSTLAVLGLPMQLLDNALKLLAIGTVVGVGMGFPLFWSICASGLIIVAYTFLGGLKAALACDFIQFLVILAVVFTLPFLCLGRLAAIDGGAGLAHGLYVFVDRAADGAFEWNSASSFAGLSIAEGGTLVFSNPLALTVDDDVSLSGVTMRVSVDAMAGRKGWTRLLVARSISGAPQLPNSNWESRIVALDNCMDALEVHVKSGMIFVVR